MSQALMKDVNAFLDQVANAHSKRHAFRGTHRCKVCGDKDYEHPEEDLLALMRKAETLKGKLPRN